MRSLDRREREQKEKAMSQPKQSEQEKLAKTGNMLIRGFAIWYLIPFIAIALVLMLMVGVWLWDMFIALF